jgi:ABC-type branched-subunit amino acid transport system ATPase component
MEITDYVYVLSKGKIVYESTPEVFQKDEEVKTKHLGVAR